MTNEYVLSTIPSMFNNVTSMVEKKVYCEENLTYWWYPEYGIRGGNERCTDWYPTTPGSFYQVFSLILHIAFICTGNSSSAAIINNFLCSIAFLNLAIWGSTAACGIDIVVWGLLVCVTNVIQLVYSQFKSRKTKEAFEGDQNSVYNQFFAPFDISRTSFTELVGIKGFHILTLQKDHCYAIANKTTVDRLGLLVSGKLRVHAGDKVLHYINKFDFVDSPEWEAVRGPIKKGALFRVTITAETTSRCVVWKRKPLLTLLTKEKQLAKVLKCVISQDVVKKLAGLNSKRFTERGFHYDIRLPCVISLRDDVEGRERRIMSQMTPNQAGQRSRKLGRRAAQDYAKLFGSRSEDRIKVDEDYPTMSSSIIDEIDDDIN